MVTVLTDQFLTANRRLICTLKSENLKCVLFTKTDIIKLILGGDCILILVFTAIIVFYYVI